MILILRGHIRNSFDNKNLYDLINEIYKIDNNLKIYIHTWNIFSNNISWRKRDSDNKIVTKDIVENYFGNLSHLIKHIIIDDDTQIKLIGNLSGTVSKSPMPLIGWKNFHYGIFTIINYINTLNISKDELIVNTRFDILNNTNSFNTDIITSFIKHNSNVNNIKKNIFLANKEFWGCDNIYIGNINTMHRLSYLMFFYLDELIKKYPEVRHQEYIYFYGNELI
jgi:hypothetical protein